MAEILVVKTETLFPAGVWQGFMSTDSKDLLKLIDEKGEYLERALAEEDDSYQQIIPQIILKVGDRIFIHRIPKTGSEARLHDLWPIFLGGHVEKTDKDIDEATQREFDEEIKYMGKILKRKFLGIIKLHDLPVNKVHVGLVWLFEGDTENFEPTEDGGVVDGQFIDIKDLPKYKGRMTHWSEAVAPYILEKYGK